MHGTHSDHIEITAYTPYYYNYDDDYANGGKISSILGDWVRHRSHLTAILQAQDFTLSGQTYDIIFDAVGKTSFSHCIRSLKKVGRYLTVDFPLLHALWTSIVGSKKVLFGSANRIEDLAYLRELIEAGKLRSVIDRCYPMEPTAEAHRHVECGHKKGNVVTGVVHHNKTLRSTADCCRGS